MVKERTKLRLGKGKSFFVKSHLKHLRQEDEIWEADFRALPKPITQPATNYIGMVIAPPHGYVLAMNEIGQSPTVNDLAKLLADAMRRPLALDTHRPRHIRVRGSQKWKELTPHLEALGIEITVEKKLRHFDEAFDEFLRNLRKSRLANRTKPTSDQAKIEKLFPTIAKWVRTFGHIEIGDQEGFGFVVRAIDYGGVIFDDDLPDTLAAALATLEKGLREYFEREGIE